MHETEPSQESLLEEAAERLFAELNGKSSEEAFARVHAWAEEEARSGGDRVDKAERRFKALLMGVDLLARLQYFTRADEICASLQAELMEFSSEKMPGEQQSKRAYWEGELDKKWHEVEAA